LEKLKFLNLNWFEFDYRNLPSGLIREDLQIKIYRLFSEVKIKRFFKRDVLSQAASRFDLDAVKKLAISHPKSAQERNHLYRIRLIEYICSKQLKGPEIIFKICDILNDVVPHSILGIDLVGLTPVHYLFRSIAQRIRTGKPVDDLLIIAKKWTNNYIEDENPPEK
jgi:hypothetical protein